MDFVLPLIFAVFGLALAAVLWITSRALASGELPALQPPCPYCPGEFSSEAWIPLIGAFSRCTNCRRTMGYGRVVLEVGLAAAFAVAAYRIDSTKGLIEIVLFSIPLVVIMLTDLWTGAVFRNLAVFGIALGLLFAGISGWETFKEALVGAGVSIAVFGIMMLVMRKILPTVHLAPVGEGDVLIAGMIGAMARWPGVILALFAGVLVAGIGAAIVLSARRNDQTSVVPFGPFLCAAALPIFIFWF
jgi:prepilin signal peptidase PulO-like enzyme (type II secretory pathway)